MGHELICSWLGLPPDGWPPDHYRLLGLEPGEGDLTLIESRVHQRLDAVRKYQGRHPEQATEAMNRLAQAFVCLTEPAAKRAYDRELLGDRAPAPPLVPPPVRAGPPVRVSAMDTPAPRDALVWLYTPGASGPDAPPVRVPPPPVRAAPAAEAVEVAAEAVAVAEAEVVVLPQPEPEPPPDPVVAAATTSPAARRGLCSRQALAAREQHTRVLQLLWGRLEKYLADPQRPLSKQEAGELYKLAAEVEEKVGDYPLLGEAGQPGYLIVNLTQLERARDLLNLTLLQREALERDWRGGLRFLEAHHHLVTEEMEAERCRGPVCKLVRRLRASLNEQPLTAALVLLALAAVAVAVWRSTL